MKINTLSKAAKLLAEIKEMDEQIIRIDKIAMSLPDKEGKNKLSLVLEKPTTEKAEIDTDGYDGIANSPYRSLFNGFAIGGHMHSAQKQEKEDFDLDEIETMIICGTLIQMKKDKRRLLIDNLIQLGYSF